MSRKSNPNPAIPNNGRPLWRLLLLWLPPFLWMGVIFAASSVPATALPSPPEYVMFLAHFLEFFILGILLFRAMNGGLRNPVTLAALFIAFLLCFGYGVLDEFHQLFVPGRVPDLLDLAADMAGAATACLISWIALTAIHRARGLAE